MHLVWRCHGTVRQGKMPGGPNKDTSWTALFAAVSRLLISTWTSRASQYYGVLRVALVCYLKLLLWDVILRCGSVTSNWHTKTCHSIRVSKICQKSPQRRAKDEPRWPQSHDCLRSIGRKVSSCLNSITFVFFHISVTQSKKTANLSSHGHITTS
jgi:hypothetical protein